MGWPDRIGSDRIDCYLRVVAVSLHLKKRSGVENFALNTTPVATKCRRGKTHQRAYAPRERRGSATPARGATRTNASRRQLRTRSLAKYAARSLSRTTACRAEWI